MANTNLDIILSSMGRSQDPNYDDILSASGGSQAGGPTVITLGTLTLSTALTTGTITNGSINGAYSGSSITSGVTGLSVNSGARTFSFDGSAIAGTTANGLVETLAGATNSPRSSAVVVAAAGVVAPLSANAPTMLSLGTRNGIPTDPGTARWATAPVMTNLFGNGTAGAAGALSVLVRFKPGELYSTGYTTTAFNIVTSVFGTNSETGGGTTACRYHPSSAPITANRGRFLFTLKDQGGNTVTLLSPNADAFIDASGILCCRLIIRRDAAGVFTASIAAADAQVLNGTTVTPAAFTGRASAIGALNLGHMASSAPAMGQGNYFPGSISDLIQVDGTGGTDSEWAQIATGADPLAVFGSSLAVHFPLRNPSDLAKASGSRAYAACTLGGTGHGIASPGKPVRSTADPSKSLYAVPLYRGYVHALDPAVVQAAQDINALRLAAGVVSRDFFVGGAATHLVARAVRMSDNVVVRDYVRVTTSPVTGKVEVNLPNVPAAADEVRIDVEREDDRSFTCHSLDGERVGVVAVFGPGQSQMFIGFRGAAANVGAGVPAEPYDYVANPNSKVSFLTVRGNYLSWTPADGGYLRHRFMVTNGILAAAAWYESLNTGIPVEFVQMSISGTGSAEWMYHSNSQNGTPGRDFWGDGVTPRSGYVTDTLLAKRKRVTMFLHSWHTAERPLMDGGALTITSVYGTRNVTERPWVERMNEFFGGIEKSTADATERSERSNLIDSNALVYQPWLVMIPQSRTSSGNAGASDPTAAKFTDFRKVQHDFAEFGTGKNTEVNATLGGFQNDIQMDGPAGPHQLLDDVYGNINFCTRLANAIVVAGKMTTLNPRSSITAATGVGTATLTVTTTLLNGGSLMTGTSGTAIAGFEVSVDGGTTWSSESGSIPFTPTISGNNIQLLKASGIWPAGARLRYLPHFPVSTGALATDRVAIKGMLYESRADMAVPGAAELPAGVPLRNSFTDIVAS